MLKALANLFKKRTNNINDIDNIKPIYSWINKDLGELQEKVTDIIHRLHIDLDILNDIEMACKAQIEQETQRLSEIQKEKEDTQSKLDKTLVLLTAIEQLKQNRP